MNLNDLQNMPLEDIRALAQKMGVRYHHSAKSGKIAQAIIDQTLAVKPPQTDMQHPAEKPQEAPRAFTPDEVLEAIKHITTAKPDFKAVFPGDGSWIFSYKGAEESGNLAIPLREITLKAGTVSRGALRLPMVKGDGTVGKGYADNIFVG